MMWDIVEGCSCCMSKAVPVIDREEKIVKCSHCGLVSGSYSIEDVFNLAENDTVHSCDNGLSIFTTDPNNDSSNDSWSSDLENFQNSCFDPFFTATTEPNNASSDDFFPSDLGNSQNHSFDPVSVSTSEPSDDFLSSNLENSQNRRVFAPLSISTTNPNNGNLQNRGSDPVSIGTMSDRLDLLAKVKNQANEIFKKVKNQSRRKKKRNAVFAACIYIACRQMDMTFSVREISYVANGANKVEIFKEIRFIAQTLQLNHNHLMLIQAADFIKRFCFTLGMDSEAAKAAEEAAESCRECDIRKSPVSIAAGITYVIAQLSCKKKGIKDIAEATGVSTYSLVHTVKDLNQHLSKIIPKWFAKVKDPENLGSS